MSDARPDCDCSPDEAPARRLTPADEAAVDRELSGQPLDSVTAGADPRRSEALRRALGLLDRYPVDQADDALLDAVLARIDRHEREAADRFRLDPVPAPTGGGRRFRLPDLISVAA